MAMLSSVGLAASDFGQGCPVAPSAQERAEILWTRPICVETNRYIGWPSVCRLKNGDILAVFSGDRDWHVCPWGKVQMVRSTDDGETWSAPTTIANTVLDDRDAGIVQMPDGEVIVTWFTSTAYRRPDLLKAHADFRRHDEKMDKEAAKAALGNFLVRSRDNGNTWSKPEKLANYAQTPHGPILMRDGSLLEIGRTSNGKTVRDKIGRELAARTIITVSRSTDAGRTWKVLCREIPDKNGENDQPAMFHEPHVAELADGTLVGLVRYHGPDNCMRVTFSKNGGHTWTPMTKTPMVGYPPHLLVLPDGKLLNVYGRRIEEAGFGEFACISDDGGKTWDVANEITLAPSHSPDLGYPSSCVLPNGDILTVYYQQLVPKQKPCLMATKWRVAK